MRFGYLSPILWFGLSVGCADLSHPNLTSDTGSVLSAVQSAPESAMQPTIRLASSQTEAPPAPGADPFQGQAPLTVEELVEQVLARNPTLAQMVAAWQAASARYPQVTSLDDPMFAATIGPETFHPDDAGASFAWRLEVAQKYPWPGKRRLRGDNALAEARAAGDDVADTVLQLIESAKDAFYEYYLVGRALAVNEETIKRLEEFRRDADLLYRTPTRERKVSFQDAVQARVEIGRQEQRRLALERARQVAMARINTLMHFDPASPLPAPPKELKVADALPEVEALRASAVARRPDLQALAERIAAEEASLNLAHKEYYPDVEPFLMYDRFMGNTPDGRDLSTMIGVRLNVPLRLARRQGAVMEANARIAQRRAELDRQIDQVNFQVEEAYARVREGERTVRLYATKILPDADLNVKTARADYGAGLVPAIAVIEAERARLDLYDRYYEAIAGYFRRHAALERAIGGPLMPLPQEAGRMQNR
jgi:outer membrane protein TolC